MLGGGTAYSLGAPYSLGAEVRTLSPGTPRLLQGFSFRFTSVGTCQPWHLPDECRWLPIYKPEKQKQATGSQELGRVIWVLCLAESLRQVYETVHWFARVVEIIPWMARPRQQNFIVS